MERKDLSRYGFTRGLEDRCECSPMPDTLSRTPKSCLHITQHQTRNQRRTLSEGYFHATKRLVREGDLSWAGVLAAVAYSQTGDFEQVVRRSQQVRPSFVIVLG